MPGYLKTANIFGLLADSSAEAGAAAEGEAAELAGGVPCIQCFEAGIKVQTDKDLKPIEQINEGDRVLSYNEQTHRNEYQPVTQTFTRIATDVWQLKVEGERALIGVTSEHPFFVRVHGARSHTNSEGEWKQTWQIRCINQDLL